MTKELEKTSRGSKEAISDILENFNNEVGGIVDGLINKDAERKAAEDKLEKALRDLGIQFIKNGKKREEEKEKEQKPEDKTGDAIKSIIPQFGSLVETGSAAALKLFSSNQNPMVKEQQQANKKLDQLILNTNTLEVR